MFAVVKKRHLITILVLIVVIVMTFTTVAVITVSAERKMIPIYCTDDENRVSISFDAAWGSDKTKRIVDICCEYGIRATFFLTGFWIDVNQEALQYIYEKGFEIGNHSDNHYNMSGLSREKQKQEIVTVNEKIKAVTGSYPILFRAPFGDYNNNLLKTIDDLNMYCIQWDVDSLDWKGLSAEELEKRVIPKVKNGSIVLFHNNSDHIVEALPSIIEGIIAKGYTLVSIGDLIYKDNYTIDSNGKQYKNG